MSTQDTIIGQDDAGPSRPSVLYDVNPSSKRGDIGSSSESKAAELSYLLAAHARQDIGEVRALENVRSALPVGRVASYAIRYPTVVIDALRDLVSEYNDHFQRLVQNNREFATDYRFAKDIRGQFVNTLVRIDMAGLQNAFLKAAIRSDQETVRKVLRHAIFEVENAPAMYDLAQNVFARENGPSLFSLKFRRTFERIRETHRRPIVLLAVTDEKFQGLRAAEFGKQPGQALADSEVRELSGFDGLYGPEEFKRHVQENGGRCVPLLYVRASEPPSLLRNPSGQRDEELLGNPELRRIIKEHAITLNIDSPEQAPCARINDTKAYLESMGMAFRVQRREDLLNSDGVLNRDFERFLIERGLNPEQVANGQARIRAKPLQGSYGGYGHIRGSLDGKFLRQLKANILARGEYVVQPELVNSNYHWVSRWSVVHLY